MGSLCDYHKGFKQLSNRVQGWPQRALVGAFMGGLKPEIANDIRMSKPKLLKESISLARMRDEQWNHQRKAAHPFSRSIADSPAPVKFKGTTPMKPRKIQIFFGRVQQ